MILQTNYILEFSSFGLTITDYSPSLWIEANGERRVLFDNIKEATEFVEDYKKIVIKTSDGVYNNDKLLAEMFIQKGLSNLLSTRYAIRYNFDDSSFEEFDEHIMGTLQSLCKEVEV